MYIIGMYNAPAIFTIVLPILLLLIFVFEVWMFIALLRNERLSIEYKLLWGFGMLIFHPFVAIAYYFLEYRKRRQ